MFKQKGFILVMMLCYLLVITLLTISGWQQARYGMKLTHGFKGWMERHNNSPP